MPCHCLCDLLQDCHHEWQSTCDCYLFSFLWELLSLKLLKITLYIRFCSWKGQCKAVNWKVIPDVTQGMKMVQLLLIKWSPILSNLTCTLKLIWELHSTKGKGPQSALSISLAQCPTWVWALLTLGYRQMGMSGKQVMQILHDCLSIKV